MTRPAMVCYRPPIKGGIQGMSVKMQWKLAAFAALAAVAAPVGAQMSDSDTFMKAVRDRDGDKVIELVEGRRTSVVNARDAKGDTALSITIARRDTAWTGYLLNHGADPDLATRSGDTPLISAARSGFNEAAEWLLAKGAKVDADNKMGETPLIIAVQQRNVALAKLLLQRGADPDKTDSAAGYSARDYAKRDSRARDILKLIEAKKPQPAAKP